jgi:hypothetical protein
MRFNPVIMRIHEFSIYMAAGQECHSQMDMPRFKEIGHCLTM